MNYLGCLLLTFMFSLNAISTERQNTIKVIGGKVQQLNTQIFEKDFPKLSKVKTSLQNEPIQVFEGVMLSDILDKYAPEGTNKVRLIATNNYEQTLNKKDLLDYGAMLAFKSDGKVISTKTRGTFRVIYDYLKYAEKKEIQVVLETNSVWQVVKIEFLK